MSEELKIEIVGSLNSTATTSEINSQLKEIKKSVDELNLSIKLDSNSEKSIKEFTKSIEKINQANKELNKVMHEEKKIIQEKNGVTKEFITQTLKSGEVIKKEIERTNRKNKAISDEINQTRKLAIETEKLGKIQQRVSRQNAEGKYAGGSETYKKGNTNTVVNYDNERKISSSKATEKFDQGTLIATVNDLKNLKEVTNDAILATLRHNKIIGEQKVLAASLNRETGHWSVTTKTSAKEQTTLSGHINQTNGEIYKQSEAVRDLSGRHMGLWEQMKIGVSRTLTWGASMTAVYGSLELFRSMVEEIKLVDSAMTELKRVFDATPEQYTSMLQQSIDMSKELGNNVHDVLQSLNEVARSFGDTMSQADMLAVTKTSMLAATVSDLSAEDAMKNLIGTMNAFKIAATDSEMIVDKMNEVDNNYAISTQQLAESMSKSASVAQVYGVSLDQLIGHTTAIGATTMEAGSQIGRALKTIYSRITTLDDAKSSLDAVGVSIYDMQGKVRPVGTILDDLAQRWNSMTDEQRQNTAVSVAGRDQLTRLVAMMENYDMSLAAVETSMNSENSATIEATKYKDSLESRLNQLSTAFTELSVSVGNAVLNDGLILTIETLADLTVSLATVVGKFGVLPPLFGTIGMVALLASKNLRIFASALIFGTEGMARATLISAGLSAGMTRLAITTTMAATAFRGLLIATGVGIAFVALGFIFEKLINVMGEASKKQEEFEESQKKNIEAMSTNKAETEELISTYKTLSDQKLNGQWDSTKEKEYLQVQSKIAEQFPALVSHIDATGQAHLKSAQQIDKEIELTNKLIEAKKEEMKAKAVDTIGEKVDENSDAEDEIASLRKKKEDLQKDKKDWGANKTEIDKMIREVETEIVSAQMRIANSTQGIATEVLKISDAYNKLEINPSVKKSVDELVSSMDLSKFEGDPKKLEDFAIRIAKLTDDMQKALDKQDSSGFDKSKQAIADLAKEFGATDVSISNFGISYDKVKQVLDGVANGAINTTQAMEVLGESTSNAGQEAETLADKYKDATGSMKELTDVVYELNEGNGLSADSIGLLLEKYPDLLAHMGNEAALKDAIKQKIIEKEDVARQALISELSMNEQFFNSMLSGNASYFQSLASNYGIDLNNAKTLAQLKAQVEAQLIQKLSQAWSKYYDVTNQKITEQGHAIFAAASAAGEGTPKWDKAQQLLDAINASAGRFDVTSIAQELNDLANVQFDGSFSSAFDGMTESIGSNSGALRGNTKEQEKNAKATDKNKEAQDAINKKLDEYKDLLDDLNVKFKEQDRIKSRHTKGSKEYIKALEEEMKLLKEQTQILKDQQDYLNGQVGSGNAIDGGNPSTGAYGVARMTTATSQKDGSVGVKWSKVSHDMLKGDTDISPLLADRLIAIAQAYGKGAVNVTSGGRTYAEQADLRRRKPKLAAKAGTSKHEIGVAADVADQWLKNLGNDVLQKFGLHKTVLSKGEDWHIELAETGSAIGRSNKSLSEIVQQLALLNNSFNQTLTNSASLGNAVNNGGTMSGNSNQATIWNYLKSKGFTDAATAGVMGNLRQESNYDPTAKNPSSGAYGIAQWLGSRKTALQKFAKNRGTSMSDITTQLDFLMSEMEGSEKNSVNKWFSGGWNDFKNTNDMSKALVAFLDGFERPAKSERVVDKRTGFANDALSMAGTGVIGGTSIPNVSSDLNGTQVALIDNAKAIEEKALEIANGWIENYNLKLKNYDQAIENSQEREKNLALDSAEYRKEQMNQDASLRGQLKENDDLYKYINDQITNNKDLSPAGIDELKDKLHEVGLAREQLKNALQENLMETVESYQTFYDRKKADYQYAIENSEIRTQSYPFDSVDYRKELEGQLKSIGGLKLYNQQELDYLNGLVESGDLAGEALQTVLDRIRELGTEKSNFKLKEFEISAKLVDSVTKYYDKAKSQYDKSMENSEIRLNRIMKGTQNYRDELEKQRKTLAGKQKENESEIAYLKQSLQLYSLSPEKIEEIQEKIHALSVENNNLINTQYQLNQLISEDFSTQYNYKLSLIDAEIAKAEQLMDLYNEGSKEYIKNQKIISKGIQDRISLTGKEIERLKKIIALEIKNSQIKQDAQDKLKEYENSQLEDANRLRDINEQIADEAIENIKRAIEKQRDLETAAIDERVKKLTEAHEKEMKQIDEKVKGYEEVIQAKLRELDDNYDEDKFNKELKKMEEERLKIQEKINELSFDDSMEAKAQKKDLQKQVDDLTEQIDEKKYDREIELRRRNLQDELDAYRKNADEKREISNEELEREQEKAEEEKKELNYKYQEMLDDERRFTKLREEILAGNIENVKGILGEYLKNFKGFNEDVIKDLELGWNSLQNLIDNIAESIGNLDTVPDNIAKLPKEDKDAKKMGRLQTGAFKTINEAQEIVDKMLKEYGAISAKVVMENGEYRATGLFEDAKRAIEVVERLKYRELIEKGYVAEIDNQGNAGANIYETAKGQLQTGAYGKKEEADYIAKVLKEQYGALATKVIEQNGQFRAEAIFDNEARAVKVLNKLRERDMLDYGQVYSLAQDGKLSKFYQLEIGKLISQSYETAEEAKKVAEHLKSVYGAISASVYEQDGKFYVQADFESADRAIKVLERLEAIGYMIFGRVDKITKDGAEESYSSDKGVLKTGAFGNKTDAEKISQMLTKDYGALMTKVIEKNGKYYVEGMFNNAARAEKVLNKLYERGLLKDGRIETQDQLGKVIDNSFKNLEKGILKTGAFATREDAEKVTARLLKDYGAITATAIEKNGQYYVEATFKSGFEASGALNRLYDLGVLMVGHIETIATDGTKSITDELKRARVETGAFAKKEDAQKLADIMRKEYGASSAGVIQRADGKFVARADFKDLEKADAVLKRLKDRKLIQVGHTYELLSAALQKQVDAERKAEEEKKRIEEQAIKDKQEAEKKKYSATQERVDKEKFEVIAKNKDILGSDREWNDVRTAIIEDHTGKVKDKLDEMLFGFAASNGMITDAVKQDWVELQKLIDDTLKTSTGGTPSSPSQPSNPSNGSTSPTTTKSRLTSGTFKSQAEADNLLNIIKSQYAGFLGGKTVNDKGLWRVVAEFDKADRAKEVLDRLKFRKLLLSGNVASFDTGGMTPDWNGSDGKFILAHQKELILNKSDTGNLLETIKELRHMIKLPKINIPKFTPDFVGAGDSIEINFNIDKMYGTENEVESFSSKIMNNIKRNKGGRF